MKKELEEYSKYIKKFVKKRIERTSLPDAKLKELLFKVFCHYSPNKERGFIINRICHAYSIDTNLSILLETGTEIVFAAYYLRDDLIDETQVILETKNSSYSPKELSLIADILGEIGNTQIALYCNKAKKKLNNLIHQGFLSLSFGQILGLKEKGRISIKEYLHVAYHKNGAMMEFAIKMLEPFLPASDAFFLTNFATDYGVASQIRNDIEDFLLVEGKENIFQDLRTQQANFVLSAHYDRTGSFFSHRNQQQFDIKRTRTILFKDIVFSEIFLSSLLDKIIKNIKNIKNKNCVTYLEKISLFTIRTNEYEQ